MLNSVLISANFSAFSPIADQNGGVVLSSNIYNSVNTFSINGTEFFEQGTWYFYQNESIGLSASVTSDIDEVYFYYEHSTVGGITANDSMTEVAANTFAESYSFDGDAEIGLYNAEIILKNSSNAFQNYSFYFHIADPEPVIYSLFIRDSAWDNEWTRIYEGQTWETYRDTTLSIGAQVGNKDDINEISEVTLGYQDGNLSDWNSVAMSDNGKTTYKGIDVVDYNSSITVDFDATNLGRKQWRPGYIYSANVTAKDDSDQEWYFPFAIKILNRAPRISSFSVTGDDIASPSANGDIVEITVNASDLEDDIIYDADASTEVQYGSSIIGVSLKKEGDTANYTTGFQSPTWLNAKNEGQQYEMNMSEGGSFGVNFSTGRYYHKHIQNWQINIRYLVNTSNDLEMWLWNASAKNGNGTWVEKTDFNPTGSDDGVWTDEVITFNMDEWNMTYFSNLEKGWKIRTKFNKTGSTMPVINMSVDYISMSYKVDRRYSVSGIYLFISGPLDPWDSYSIIDMSTYWDTDWAPGNQWSFRYNITGNQDHGAYTFAIRAYDWGSVITDNILNSRSINFGVNDRGRVEVSHLVNYGVPRSQINHVEGLGVDITNRQELDPTTDGDIELTVADTTNAYSGTKTENVSVGITRIYQQNGSGVYTVGSNKFSLIDSEDINTAKGHMQTNGLLTTNLTLTDAAEQSIILEYNLDDWYWLGEKNVSGLRLHWNWYFDDIGQNFDSIKVSFFDWSTNDWTADLWTNTTDEEFSPVPVDKNETGRVYSTSWLNGYNFPNIINETRNNLLLARFVIESSSSYGDNLNVSLAFEQLEVQFDNTYTCQAIFRGTETQTTEVFNMTDIYHDATKKTWSLQFPSYKYIPQDFFVTFVLQNGESVAKMYAARKQGYLSTLGNKTIVQTGYGEEMFYDRNQTMSIRSRQLGSTFEDKQGFIYTDIEALHVNGSLSTEAQTAFFNYSQFYVQWNNNTAGGPTEWPIISMTDKYNSSTGIWNKSEILTHQKYDAGRAYYRLFLEMKDGNTFATEWEDIRILNYQPRVTKINELDLSNPFYREDTELNFDIQIREVETDPDDLTLSFVLPCNDRTVSNNPLIWSRVASFSYTSEGNDYYNLTGSVKFGSEINIGTYDNLFIYITDDETIQQQTGAERISGSIQILNSPITVDTALQSNVTSDEIFRENTLELSWNFTDNDDSSPLNNFTATTFTVEDPDDDVVSLQTSNINWDPISKLFEYNYYFNRDNLTGIYTFTVRYEDPDGSFAQQTIEITVKNNLPIMTELKLENIDRDFYVSHTTDNNISSFWIYRGFEDMRVTVNLTDIEDSYQGSNKVSEVYITMNHEYSAAQGRDPWPNTYFTWDTNLTYVSTTTLSGVETEQWEGILSLPTSQYFYAGPMELIVNMKDQDLDVGTNGSHVIQINNSAPEFVGNQYNVTIGTTMGGKTVESGSDIKLYIYYNDDDFDRADVNNELDLSQVYVKYRATGPNIPQKTITETFERGEWTYDSSEDAIYVTIKTGDDNAELSDAMTQLEFTEIIIYDNDWNKIEDTDVTGEDQAKIDISYTVTIQAPPDNSIPIIWIILPIVAVGLGIFGVWYYRKYFSYKKYMD